MTSLPNSDNGRESNLLVRIALLEQKLEQVTDQAKWLRESYDSRSRQHDGKHATTMERLRQVERHLGQITTEVAGLHHFREVHGGALTKLEGRQLSHQQLADRLRYGAAAVLVVMALAGRIAPETLGKALKVLALVP